MLHRHPKNHYITYWGYNIICHFFYHKSYYHLEKKLICLVYSIKMLVAIYNFYYNKHFT